MESQKIINYLDHKDEGNPRFETKSSILLMTVTMEIIARVMMCSLLSNLIQKLENVFCFDYSDAYILVTGDIKVAAGYDPTRLAINNCHPFTRAFFRLNDEQVDTPDNLDLIMNSYSMLEYNDNYADTTASLYQYKRPEQKNANGVLNDLTVDNSSSFKYQSVLVQNQLTTPNSQDVLLNADPSFNAAHRVWKNI